MWAWRWNYKFRGYLIEPRIWRCSVYSNIEGSGGLGGEAGFWVDLFNGDFGRDRDQEVIDNIRSMISSNSYTEISASEDFTKVGSDSKWYVVGTNTYTYWEYTINCQEVKYVIRKTELTVETAGASSTTTYSYSYYQQNIQQSDGNTNEKIGIVEKGGKKLLVSTDSNKVLYFINYARLYLNALDTDAWQPTALGYLFIYIVLIVFTGMFAIRYMKRVIYIAFLTLMAPMVALTYPLDKIKDRKSASI